MNFHYLFQDRINHNDINCNKPIVVKQTSKYKYTLELYKKPVETITNINDIKNGSFLYIKNNKYCIYDARNYLIKQFNEPAEFLITNYYFTDIDSALRDLFNKSNFL